MKKLGKLDINQEKLMKNEELLTLKGGYGVCHCYCRDDFGHNMGQMAAQNQSDCTEFCGELGWDGEWNCI